MFWGEKPRIEAGPGETRGHWPCGACGDTRVYLEVEIRRVECKKCGKVKQETVDWLADHPFYTKRFAFFVGRRCRTMTIKDVAEETRLDWKAIKALDEQYMQEQLRRAGTPAPVPFMGSSLAIQHFPIAELAICTPLRPASAHASRDGL